MLSVLVAVTLVVCIRSQMLQGYYFLMKLHEKIFYSKICLSLSNIMTLLEPGLFLPRHAVNLDGHGSSMYFKAQSSCSNQKKLLGTNIYTL